MSNSICVVSDYSQSLPEFSLFGYHSLLPGSTITPQQAGDADYPIENALDYRMNTQFSTVLGSEIYVFEQGALGQADYFAITSLSAVRVQVEIYDEEIDAYVEVLDISDIEPGKPRVVYFGDQKSQGYYDTLRQRITVIKTPGKPYIVSMNIGKAMIFPHTPSLGFQPAHLNPQDKVKQYRINGKNLTRGRRVSMGHTAKGTINYVPMDDLDGDWPPFQEHVLNGLPLYFLWSNKKDQQAVYGTQNPDALSKPTYATSFHANIEFEINGFA